jgi:hypothetical protein
MSEHLPPGSLPPNYEQLLYWQLAANHRQAILLQILSIPLFVLFGFLFAMLAARLGNMPAQIQFGLVGIGFVLLGVLATLALHELAHGLTMRLFGASPQYGVILKKGVLYATSPGFAFTRNSYLMIALAPLIGLTALVILGMMVGRGTTWVALLALCGAVNGAGAIGDLWMSAIVARYNRAAYVIDERDGMRVFLPRRERDTDATNLREWAANETNTTASGF